jgi:2-methylcitrate dehydratase PrpD
VESLSPAGRLELKIRILDALGCAIGALGGGSVRRIRQFVSDFSHDGPGTLIGGRSAPHRAALMNCPEVHSQTAIEAALELQHAHGFDASHVKKVEVDVFEVAYCIIGGGEDGDKTLVFSKEDAHHSLPYLIAVAPPSTAR